MRHQTKRLEAKARENRPLTFALTAALLCLALLGGPFCGNAAAEEPGLVIAASLTGTVNAPMEEFVKKVITRAKEQEASLIVFILNESNGSFKSARNIAQSINASKTPVAVWIPQGGRATPTGTLILQAAHIAAMAPDARIGASASVVTRSANDDNEVLQEIIAQMRAMPRLNDRNPEALSRMFKEKRSADAVEAAEEGLIDIVANTREVLILASSGRYVSLDGQWIRTEASVDRIEEFSTPAPPLTGKVILSSLSGTVSVQMEEFVKRVIAKAEEERAGLIVFKLDTPGGLVSATHDIIRSILNSEVPVAMWVPRGGRAASAGAFMVQAAHIAAMASGTNIGAARPVMISGTDIDSGDMKEKVVNDLTAQMDSLTHLRGRDERTARQMIEISRSLPMHEALEEGVIDFSAENLEELLAKTRGKEVDVNGRMRTLEPSADQVEDVEMSLQERLIHFLSSPDIAYMLLVGGLLAVFYEIITPGGFVLGITGTVLLLLGSIGLKMLPFNWAGVALVGAGVIIMGIDLLIGGMGLLSLLGVAALAAGGLFMFHAPGGELLRVSMSVIVGMAVTLGLTFTLFALMVIKSLRARVVTGQQSMTGIEVEVVEDLNPEGLVRCRGEIWKARCKTHRLDKGASAVVLSIEGLVLIVGQKPCQVSGKNRDLPHEQETGEHSS